MIDVKMIILRVIFDYISRLIKLEQSRFIMINHIGISNREKNMT